MVEPPATVGLGLCSAAIHDVSYDFLSAHCVGAKRVEFVVGQDCQRIGLHGN